MKRLVRFMVIVLWVSFWGCTESNRHKVTKEFRDIALEAKSNIKKEMAVMEKQEGITASIQYYNYTMRQNNSTSEPLTGEIKCSIKLLKGNYEECMDYEYNLAYKKDNWVIVDRTNWERSSPLGIEYAFQGICSITNINKKADAEEFKITRPINSNIRSKI